MQSNFHLEVSAVQMLGNRHHDKGSIGYGCETEFRKRKNMVGWQICLEFRCKVYAYSGMIQMKAKW